VKRLCNQDLACHCVLQPENSSGHFNSGVEPTLVMQDAQALWVRIVRKNAPVLRPNIGLDRYTESLERSYGLGSGNIP